MDKDKHKRLALLQSTLQRQRPTATGQQWIPSPAEAGQVFDILANVGGVELIEQIINFQTTGVFSDGNSTTSH